MNHIRAFHKSQQSFSDKYLLCLMQWLLHNWYKSCRLRSWDKGERYGEYGDEEKSSSCVNILSSVFPNCPYETRCRLPFSKSLKFFSKTSLHLHFLFISLGVKVWCSRQKWNDSWFLLPFRKEFSGTDNFLLTPPTLSDKTLWSCCLHSGDSWARVFTPVDCVYNRPADVLVNTVGGSLLTKFLISIQICQTSFWHSVSTT